jgi:putative FmdB family regulatory protein
MPYFDYICAVCDEKFEALTQGDDKASCAACGSARVVRQAVSRIAVMTSAQRRGGVVDLSSGACPCAGRGPAHRH